MAKTLENPGIKMSVSTAMRKVSRLFVILQREVESINNEIKAVKNELTYEMTERTETKWTEKLEDAKSRKVTLVERFDYVKDIYSQKLKAELEKVNAA